MEYRNGTEINEQWESIFVGDSVFSTEEVLAKEDWKSVELPHNWDNYHGYHRVSHGNFHGTAWYRKIFSFEPEWEGKQVYLLFEGVGSYAEVWLNGVYLGGHKGGRTCFSLNMTPHLKKEEKNMLLVCARHPEKIKDLPWICGGCFGTPNTEGSQPLGIFRPVHIQVTGDVRIKPFGVYVTTPNITQDTTGNRADIHIESELKNTSEVCTEVIIKQELLDETGKLLGCVEKQIDLEPYQESLVEQNMTGVKGIQLWYPDSPILYRIRTTILRSGKTQDIVENSFGFRKIMWENFVKHEQNAIDLEKIEEEPGEQNHNFVTYLRGSEKSDVAIIPGGVHVRMQEFTPERVVISLETFIKNQTEKKHLIQLESFVQTFNRTKSIANLVTKTEILPGETITITQICDPLAFPDFWTKENPVLHNVISTVRGIDEELREYCQTTTPFRICECDGLVNKGDAFVLEVENGKKQMRRFMINEKPYFLNGSCEYEHELGNDHAFTKEMINTRMEMFEAAGFNAFREAHCPHNLRYLEYCDRHGILYWAQMGAHIYFDTEEFRENFLLLTEEWMKERRNSPSIILWSIQNESMISSEFTAKITQLIHKLDKTAPTQRKAVTCNGGTGSDWNIPQNWSGTYGGTVEDYAKEAVEMSLIGEYGQYRVKGKHQEGDMNSLQNTGGDVCEELFTYCLETKVREAEKVRDYFYGHFQWIFTTHANPGRELLYCLDGKGTNGVGVVNSKGIFTSWGEPTDVYYMYRSNYVCPEQEPMIYIVSHSWPERFKTVSKGDIHIYSNCEEVEIYNDFGEEIIGKQKRGKKGQHFIFKDVQVKYGVLTAKGYYRGECMAIDRIYFPALELPTVCDISFEDAEKLLAVDAAEDDLYRVNCGGCNYQDKKGFLWSADQMHENGKWGWKSWGMDFDNVENEIGSFGECWDLVVNTKETGLFHQFRYGREKLSYHFPVEQGKYQVELYFTEPWYGTAGENACGWRVFDVAVNEQKISKFDIFKEAAGSHRVIKKSLIVYASDEEIQISFPKVYSNQALISAIRIRKA